MPENRTQGPVAFCGCKLSDKYLPLVHLYIAIFHTLDVPELWTCEAHLV